MFALVSLLLRLLVSPPNLPDIALESGPSSTARSVQAKVSAASAATDGSLLLGVVVQELGGLAPSLDHRKTGDGRGLASQGLSPVLELDFQAEERTSRSQPRG